MCAVTVGSFEHVNRLKLKNGTRTAAAGAASSSGSSSQIQKCNCVSFFGYVAGCSAVSSSSVVGIIVKRI